nr:tRNA lysidine(34) synthetase TilS [Arsenicicoccus dermatophilus]
MDQLPEGLVLVACSGGTDSLALASAVAFEVDKTGRAAGAVVVDHGLQDGSVQVAAQAADRCRDLGLHPVVVRRVEVRAGAGGPEDAARTARHGALAEVAAQLGAVAVLLAHTRDDQAEQVLLGLARGSGARSLAGMPPVRGIVHRPLLGVTREDTTAVCRHDGLTPWADPHNADPTYARVRARALMPLLEEQLGPGIRDALARSAALLRADADALDALAQDWLAARAAGAAVPDGTVTTLPAAELAALSRAVRSRVLHRAALAAGATPGALTAAHVDALDALVTRWRGQGPVALPGSVTARRTSGRAGQVELERDRRSG